MCWYCTKETSVWICNVDISKETLTEALGLFGSNRTWRRKALLVSVPCLFRQEKGLTAVSGVVSLLEMLFLTVRCPDVVLGPLGVGLPCFFLTQTPTSALFLCHTLLKPISLPYPVKTHLWSTECVLQSPSAPRRDGSLAEGSALAVLMLKVC